MSDKYWEVVESFVGWRVYHIPAEVCPSEQEALDLVDDMEADEYTDLHIEENFQVESFELKEDQMDVMDLNKLVGLLEDMDTIMSEIALVTYNVPKEIDDAVDDLNHAVIMLNSAVDALGRNPQDILKGERDE